MDDNADKQDPVLEAEDVSATYDGRTVLNHISLRVHADGVVGLIGPNGSGKTTLLRLLSGALRCSAGIVRVMGQGVERFAKRDLARTLAFVPQAVEVPVAYTVADVVAMGRTPYVSGWAPLSSKDRDAVRRAMALMDVEALSERPIDELSSGERQRAIVAMALAQEPKILLLDEPIAHLDIQHAWTLMSLIAQMNREQQLAVVVSLHDLNLAAEFCPQLHLLDGGTTAASGAAAEVLDPAILARVYRHPIETIQRGDGRLVVVPGAK